jgi:Zn-dependent peptidase ImmA (M78 family)
MTVKWEKFAGSTDVFAIRLSFSPDPDEGVAIDRDESASWGRLQLWVKGQNLCAHVDQGEFIQGVHWYMLPFLEWVANSWNPLLHEERLPNRNIGDNAVESLAITRNAPALASEVDISEWDQEWYDWHQRHSLRAARNGGLFPNVLFRRLRDQIEVSWDGALPAGTPAGFRFNLAQGSEQLNPEDVAGPLYDVTFEAVRYLRKFAPGSVRLESVYETLLEVPNSNQRDIRLGWLADLPIPENATDRLKRRSAEQLKWSWERLTEVLQTLSHGPALSAALAADDTPLVLVGSCQAALLFGSVSPKISESDVYTLGDVLIRQYSRSRSGDDALEILSEDVPADRGSQIWEQGYDLAESLHDVLNLTGDWVDVRQVLRRFGIQELRRDLKDTGIRGCSIVGPHHKPTIVINRSWRYSRSPAGVRFTIAHELCHILYDRSRGRKLAVASGPWAPRTIEKRANAFAAMFLMPPHLIEHAVADSPDPITELAGVKAVARKLHVSVVAAIEHLCNLTLMTEIERDELLARQGSAENISLRHTWSACSLPRGSSACKMLDRGNAGCVQAFIGLIWKVSAVID